MISGAVVNAFTLDIDVAPTFADLAGATTPAFVDDRSLVHALHDLAVDPNQLDNSYNSAMHRQQRGDGTRSRPLATIRTNAVPAAQ